ncbi:MAG: sulfite exporter TauE/SafE family protein [Chloroflexi bacterium]|nr:sulfite exporter TauE/SafE family protein [Chloroflexota bacterium]
MTWLALSPLFFVVAFLYSSVGHGGASGYLALMALFLSIPSSQMSTTALILNLLVAGASFFFYWRSGHFSGRLTWPFTVASVPAALVGGMLSVEPRVYSGLLAVVLFLAALRLILALPAGGGGTRQLRLPLAIAAGGGIGLVSGIIGIGGGIFLSPLLILARWADPKRTSATSALFIVANSASGLLGRAAGGTFAMGPLWPIMGATLTGGLLGSYLGSGPFSGPLLRRLLGVVLLLAAAKLAQGIL